MLSCWCWPFWCCQQCDLPLGDHVGGTGRYCRLVTWLLMVAPRVAASRHQGVTAELLFTGIFFCYFSVCRCLYYPSLFFQPQRMKWKSPLIRRMSGELFFVTEWERQEKTCHGWYWSVYVYLFSWLSCLIGSLWKVKSPT